MLDDVDGLARLHRDRQRLARAVGAERDEAWALRLHHDQRYSCEPAVPATRHLERLEPYLRVHVKQRVVREVNPVLLVQLHLGGGNVCAADLAGRAVEPDPRHVPDRWLLDPARPGDTQPYVDRRAAARAGVAVTFAGHPAVRTGIRSSTGH